MGSSIEEYDDFRPCFFSSSGEDEFYDAPAPSEDIWKKFELLPTPPRSPKHETLYSSVLMPSTLENLRYVSEMLDDPITKTALSLTDICPPKCMDVCCNFNSKLIHDCMWSGHIVPQEFKLGQSTCTDSSSDRNTSSYSRARSCSFSLTLDSTSCVDPNVAAVFPYPVNDQSTRQIQREGSVGAETPSDSDSDSSDDDEEDEEIDVVTVADKVQMAARPRPPTTSRPVLPPTPTSAVSAQVAAMAMHNYTATAPRSPKADSSSSSSSSSPSQRHSSSTPRSSSSSSSRSLVQKRPRHHHHHHHPNKKAKFTLSSKFSVSSSSELRTVIHKYQRLSNNARANSSNSASSNSNRCSSDSEDSDGRRAQHNVLERKRRNDLKSSFHRLRDAVPDLQAQERAAKVTILKKAADHILSLRRTHQTLVTEHDRQKRTNEALQRRLRQLRSK